MRRHDDGTAHRTPTPNPDTTMTDRLRCHITVAAVVARDDRFLLVEEVIDGQRVWNQPAGHLEAGETLIEAVTREVLEETGHRFTPTGWLGASTLALPSGAVSLRIAFVGELDDTPVGAPQPPIVAVDWLSPDDLAERRLRSPLTRAAIDDFRRGRRLPLDALAHFDTTGSGSRR